MNEKEVAEIRRRFHPDKSNITCVHGCYVNEKREILSEFHQSLALMPEEESEKMLAILKRTLSGTLGKNLLDITFTTAQVVESEEHKCLMALRNTALGDEEAVKAFFQKVINVLSLEGNYLILMAHDTYDVPYRSKDGQKQEDASSEVFSYILCSICPVKMTKPALGYFIQENEFRSCKTDRLVGAPELGFLFPAFDDRGANIYNALYYSRDISESHQEFVDAVFRSNLPMPAAAQKETFQSILADTLEEDCKLEIVQAVHGQLREMMIEHKANKDPEPLTVSKSTVKNVLEGCGVSQARVEAFDEKYNAEFGEETTLSAHNIVDPKQLEMRTPDVTIRVNPERGNLVQTRVIDGTKYLMIRVEDGVEVNGVNISIS